MECSKGPQSSSNLELSSFFKTQDPGDGPRSNSRCLMACLNMGHNGPYYELWLDSMDGFCLRLALAFFLSSTSLFALVPLSLCHQFYCYLYVSPAPVIVTGYPLRFPMTSAGISSYRDRTSEFRSLSEKLKKIGGMAVANQAEHDPATSRSLASASSRSEFNKKASRIGLGIHEICLKISRLAKLAKKSSMFDDPIMEIQELTSLIKDDITALNVAVSDLQTLQNLEIADGNYSEDRLVHSNTVCDDLKNKLMGATKQFQDVLTTRTENIKSHENRKQIFSTNASRESPFQQHGKIVTEPPPWSSLLKTSGDLQPSVLPPSGVQVGSQLRRRLAVDNAPSNHMEESMLQQVVPRQENHTQSRALALQNVESTISELSGIFSHLATMVTQQGELAIRIDDNMDESLANVEGAQSALVKHLNQISSNRWLLIKIFAILIFFLMIFIFFVV